MKLSYIEVRVTESATQFPNVTIEVRWTDRNWELEDGEMHETMALLNWC